jgi:hypothetical protein
LHDWLRSTPASLPDSLRRCAIGNDIFSYASGESFKISVYMTNTFSQDPSGSTYLERSVTVSLDESAASFNVAAASVAGYTGWG